MITLINGNIQNQSGMFVPNGSISFQLNIDATVIAEPYGIIPAEQVVTFQFNSDGDIQPLPGESEAQIYSNAELNPQNSLGLGTYYLVSIYDANGARLNKLPMWWQFTEEAGATVDISQMVPFSTVGGNVIFYPTTFEIEPPSPTSLGGLYSNAGGTSLFVTSINTNGSVSLAQPSFSDISGTLSADQLPNPLTFNTITASGLITAQAGVQIGVVGVTAGQIQLEGSTSGAVTITAPAVAGTASNPVVFSNSIQAPSGGAFVLGGDTGLSRASAAVVDVGNGTPGDSSGTINASAYQVGGTAIAASNLSNGTTGTGSIVLAASPTLSGTITAAAITASGLITADDGIKVASGKVIEFSTDTGLSRQSAGVVAIGDGTAGDVTGTIQATVLQLGAIGTGPTITFGSGAPSGSAVNGSLYVNTAGTHAGTTLLYIYDFTTTTWVGIA